MEGEFSNSTLTILVIIMLFLLIATMSFSAYSFFYLRNKQFAPCGKAEYRNIN